MNSTGRAASNIAASLLVSGLTIAAVEACSRFVFPIPSPAPILLMAVVFCSFALGMPSGFLSAFLVIVYGAYFYIYHKPPSLSQALNLARLLTLAATAPLMAILTGLLQRRAQASTTQSIERESHERFRQALINAPVPLMMHTEDGQILLLSDEWTRQSGYTLVDIPKLSDWLRAAHGENAA